jgi:hypothetical protein
MRFFLIAYVCLFLWALNADSNHAQDRTRAQSPNSQTDKPISAGVGATPRASNPTTQQDNDNPRPWYEEPQWIAVILTALYVSATIYYVVVSHRMLA